MAPASPLYRLVSMLAVLLLLSLPSFPAGAISHLRNRRSQILARAWSRVAPANAFILSDSNFQNVIGKDKAVLVDFYLNGCPHCEVLKPEFERLAADLSALSSQITVAAANGHEDAVNNLYDVRGYPTVMFFARGSARGEKYDGPNTAAALKEWLATKGFAAPAATPGPAGASFPLQQQQQQQQRQYQQLSPAIPAHSAPSRPSSSSLVPPNAPAQALPSVTSQKLSPSPLSSPSSASSPAVSSSAAATPGVAAASGASSSTPASATVAAPQAAGTVFALPTQPIVPPIPTPSNPNPLEPPPSPQPPPTEGDTSGASSGGSTTTTTTRERGLPLIVRNTRQRRQQPPHRRHDTQEEDEEAEESALDRDKQSDELVAEELKDDANEAEDAEAANAGTDAAAGGAGFDEDYAFLQGYSLVALPM